MTPAPYRGLSVYYFGSGSTGSMERRGTGLQCRGRHEAVSRRQDQ